MASLSSLVSTFRAKHKLFSDDTKWTDRVVIAAFNMARTKLAYQWSQSQKGLSRQWYVGFCLPLCPGHPIKCPCLAESQCYALVSKYQLPSSISLSGNASPIYIRTIQGRQLPLISPQESDVMNLNPAFKNKPGYWIENYRGYRYLVVWNSMDIDVVYVDMVPEDLDAISAIPGCDDDGNETDCIDWTTETYPIESNLEYDLFLMTEALLLQSARPGDDTLNDAVDKITE